MRLFTVITLQLMVRSATFAVMKLRRFKVTGMLERKWETHVRASGSRCGACLRQALLRHVSQAAERGRQQRRLRPDAAAAVPRALGLPQNWCHPLQEAASRIDMCICEAASPRFHPLQVRAVGCRIHD